MSRAEIISLARRLARPAAVWLVAAASSALAVSLAPEDAEIIVAAIVTVAGVATGELTERRGKKKEIARAKIEAHGQGFQAGVAHGKAIEREDAAGKRGA